VINGFFDILGVVEVWRGCIESVKGGHDDTDGMGGIAWRHSGGLSNEMEVMIHWLFFGNWPAQWDKTSWE
jgi:hypothetical protein